MNKNNELLQVNLTDAQVKDLARPLVWIISEYFKDPKNEEKFQEWLKERADKTVSK